MPGVPTGRACDACRRQKKKCDENQPTCSRCARLKMKCVGSGMQRFKFQEEKRFSPPKRGNPNNSSEDAISTSLTHVSSNHVSTTRAIQHIYMRIAPGTPSSGLSNRLTNLTNAFIQTINRSTDLRYNLWWAFGAFMEDVPCRLGSNDALDCAIDAVTTAHRDFCSRHNASVDALAKYSKALRTLRIYLDDTFHAQSSNTLCAVTVLLICQMFLGQSTQYWSGHAEGAASILKARTDFGPRDMFEQKLFLSLRGMVLFEGLFNNRINLTPEEWTELVTNDFDAFTPEGQMLQYLSQGPDLMRRGRVALQGDTTGVRDEVWTVYQNCMINLSILRLRARENDVSGIDMSQMTACDRALVRSFMYAHHERTYGIGLAVALFFNCLLGALGAHDGVSLFDAVYLAEEILALGDRSAPWRPIGTLHLIVCLSAAWAATTDAQLRARLLVAIQDYGSDLRVRGSQFTVSELDLTAERMRLGTAFCKDRERYIQGAEI